MMHTESQRQETAITWVYSASLLYKREGNDGVTIGPFTTSITAEAIRARRVDPEEAK